MDTAPAAQEPDATDISAKRLWVTFLLIFVVALAVRFAHLDAFSDSPYARMPVLDAAHYDEWGKEIAGGDWIGDEVFLAMPAYPYFVGLIYSVTGGDTILAPLVVQCLLSALTAALVFLLGTRLLSYRVGCIAAALAAVFTPFLFTSAQLLSETLTLTVNTVLLLCAATSLQAGRRRLFALGLLVGLAALCRVQILLFAILWAGALLLMRPEGRWRVTGAFALGVALAILPVTARNWIVSGDPVLISANGGINFFTGNNPRSNGLYSPPPFLEGGRAEMYAAARDEAQRREGQTLSPRQVDSFWYGEGLAWVSAHPGAWLDKALDKFGYFWSGYEVPDILDFYDARQHSAWLSIPVDFHLVGILGFVGLIVAFGQRRELLPLYLYVASQILFVMIFFMSARFRLLAAPALLIFAAYAVVWAVAALRRREWSPLAASGLGLGIACALVFAQPPGVTSRGYSPAEKLTNDARVLLKAGNMTEGERALREAISIKPSLADAHFLLGTVLEQRAQHEAALSSYLNAAQANPKLAIAFHKAGVMYLNHFGDPVRAEQLFRATVAIAPGDATAHYNLGLALYSQRRFDEARVALATAHRLDPSIDPEIRVPAN